MNRIQRMLACLFLCIFSIMLGACVKQPPQPPMAYAYYPDDEKRFAERLPRQIDAGGEKTILVDPVVFAWGAYDNDGSLVRAGIATSGAYQCPDEKGSCRTDSGTFRISSMHGEECASRTYPRPKGGALMPYCMFFNGGQSLHGAPDQLLTENNISHGCIRMRIVDAEWVQNHFARIGTKVIIRPY